jgi:glycolate oxidase
MEAGGELIARARLTCGEQHVITTPTVLSTYRSDGLRRSGPLPLAAILPATTSEVMGVVAACAATNIPYIVRGAGTSVSGGTLPAAGSVVIVLTRMRRILQLSSTGDEITAQAGTPPAALARAAPARWFAEASPLGTLGGYIAETRGITNVSALDLVQPDGALIRLDSRHPGYDLTGAFPGSRGKAGIAVAITLRALALR